METLLSWAKGPLFWMAISFMVLGLLRQAVIIAIDIRRVMLNAGDKSLPYRQLVRTTASWLFPITKIKDRVVYSLSTFLFHVSIIIVPIFLAGHINLWRDSIGISWPALPSTIADVLTFVALITAFAIIVQRLIFKDARHLSRFQDYAIPFLIALPFISGYFVMHPASNPLPYETMMLIHVLSANLILILTPLSKISHCVLMPFMQLVSEVAWHFPSDSGTRVAVALKKENEAI